MSWSGPQGQPHDGQPQDARQPWQAPHGWPPQQPQGWQAPSQQPHPAQQPHLGQPWQAPVGAPPSGGYAGPGWTPYGAPAAPPPPQKPALLAAALPAPEQVYAQALRPLPRRTGRWFLAWAIAIGFFFGGQIVAGALLMPALVDAMLSAGPAQLQDPSAATELVFEAVASPLGMLGVNLSWAAMIPGAIVATAAFGPRAAGYASSVVGRWRWGLVGRSAIVIVPIFALYIGLSLSMDRSIEWTWDPNWALVAIVLLTTPLQATGEEFAFRGFLTQMLGGWIRNPWAASLITGAGIGLLFGLAHGHTAISATLQLALVGFACSMLTFRTGGLEAASVLHTANNVFIMVPLALTGQSAFSAQPVAGEDWLSLGLAALALGLAYAAVHFTMPRAQRRTSGAPGAELLLPQPRLAPPVAVPTS